MVKTDSVVNEFFFSVVDFRGKCLLLKYYYSVEKIEWNDLFVLHEFLRVSLGT